MWKERYTQAVRQAIPLLRRIASKALNAVLRRPAAFGIGVLIIVLSAYAVIEILGEWPTERVSPTSKVHFIAGVRNPKPTDWIGRPTLRIIVKEGRAGQFTAAFELTLPKNMTESTAEISLLIDPYPISSSKFLNSRDLIAFRTVPLFRQEGAYGVVWKSKDEFPLPLGGSHSWVNYPFERFFGIWKLFFFDSAEGRWENLDLQPALHLSLPATYRVEQVDSISEIPEGSRSAMFPFILKLTWNSDVIFVIERERSIRAGVIALISIFLVPLFLLWQSRGSFDFLNAVVCVIAVRAIVLGQASKIYLLDLVFGGVLVIAALILLLRSRRS